MIFLCFLVLLCIGNCYTDEFLPESIEFKHSHIMFERDNISKCSQIVVRIRRQNVVSQVKQKVDAPNPQTSNKDSKIVKPTEQKMKPRTNSHKNSHSAPSRRAQIAASLKLKLKPILKTRPISKFYLRIKKLTKKVFSKTRVSVKSKFSSVKKKIQNSKQLSKKLSSKMKAFLKQAQKRFIGLKSKYFSKAKYLSKNAFKAKVKLATKGKDFYKKVKSRFSGLKSKYFSNKERNFVSKLKKNLISKTSKLTKNIIKKRIKTVQSCGIIRRSKRASNCSPVNPGIITITDVNGNTVNPITVTDVNGNTLNPITVTDVNGRTVNPHSPNWRAGNKIFDSHGFQLDATDADYEKEIDVKLTEREKTTFESSFNSLKSQGNIGRAITSRFKKAVKEQYLKLREEFKRNPELIKNELDKNDPRAAKSGLHRLNWKLKGKIAVDIPDSDGNRGLLRLVLKESNLDLVAVSNHYGDLPG